MKHFAPAGLIGLALLLTLAARIGRPAALPGDGAPPATPVSAVPLLTPEADFGAPSKPQSTPALPAARPALPRESALAAPHSAPASSPAALDMAASFPFMETPAPVKTFRVGYLPRSGEGGLTETLAHNLGRWLEDNLKVRSALRAAGYSGEIVFQAADGHNDLRNGLDSRQFEMSFCPAAVFATMKPGYRVVLQEKHPRDTWDSRGSGQILRQGVIFAGPRSPLFKSGAFSNAALKEILAKKPLAVPSAYDAAGYQYPMLALANRLNLKLGAVHLRFCGSSEEVVKHVVSGLAEIGACDRAVLESWLPKVLPESVLGGTGKTPLEDIVHILPVEIPMVPTDPVIVLAGLHPEISEIGRVIKEEMPRFFEDMGADAPFTLEKRAKDEFYDRLWADLEMLETLSRGEGARR